MITGVVHTGLVVKDMEPMIRFYGENFGFEKVLDTQVEGPEADNIVNFHIESERIVVMALGDKQIEMLEYRPSGREYPQDYRSNDLFGVHLALETDDMEMDYQRLVNQMIAGAANESRTNQRAGIHIGPTEPLFLAVQDCHLDSWLQSF